MTQFVDNFLDSLPEFEPISRLLVQFEDKYMTYEEVNEWCSLSKVTGFIHKRGEVAYFITDESFDCKGLREIDNPIEYYGNDLMDYDPTFIKDLGFDAWIKSDNVWQDKDDRYLTQCSQYMIPMTLEQLETYFKKEYIE
jgi:hypothetical protein